MPIMQWLYFDALECLPEAEDVLLTEEECAPVSLRDNLCCTWDLSHTHSIMCFTYT